jgi:TolB protein
MKKVVINLLVMLAGWTLVAQTEQPKIVIEKWADPTKEVPVSIKGFTGEVASVLKFDLEVMGCKVVPEEVAAYNVEGSNEGNVQGRLFVGKTRNQLIGKSYTGGTLRSQAHAFADDIIYAITGVKGVAQTKIAFKGDFGSHSEIFIADYDGYNPIQITKDNSIAAAPCWVPGKFALVYNSYKSGFPDIYHHDLSSGIRKVIAKYSGSNISPAVSPDGSRVAMILSKGGSPNLYVANIDGSGLQRLTSTREGESSPCWSPDGKTICFASRVGGSAALYTIPATGGQMKRLQTIGAVNATEPDWSPDGSMIAFTAQMGGFQICIVPATGGEAKILTAGADPSWAPNSRTIIFTRNTGRGGRSLSLIDIYTKQVKDCHRISVSCSQPSWAK